MEPQIEQQLLPKPKILLVDDRPENLLALERLLKDLPLELFSVTSGNEALKLTLHHDFALALLDIQMPEMDGYELAEILRSEEKTSGIPFIFISAIYTDNINVFRGYEKGAFSYITKPFEPEVLLNKVNFFLEKYQNEQMLKHTQVILERKVEERTRELAKKEYQFRQTLENMLEGAGIINFEWEYIYVNEAFARQSRCNREELIGHTMMELYPEKENIGAYELIYRCMEEREPAHFEYEFTLSEGFRHWFEVSAHPVDDGVFILTLDITKRKEAEEILRKSNEDLEEMVKQRTEELMLVNRELESFSYSVSHDLKAPLRAMQGYSSILSERYSSEMDETAARWLEFIRSNAERMDKLLNAILEISRLSRREIRKSKLDMKRLVMREFEREKLSCEKPVHFSLEELPEAWGDSVLLEVVWQNLIGNALKYSSNEDTIEVTVSGYEDGDRSYYSIKDNGVGFDMKFADKIFGIFQRLHNHEEFQGTGIGLANVKRIIDKHDGIIEVDSKPGEGATFTFSLPHPLEKEN